MAALRARSETGWDAIGDAVRDRIRATPRPGRLVGIAGPRFRVPGDLSVREQAFRAVLARALRADACAPTAIDLRIENRELTGVRVRLRAEVDAELRIVVRRARHIVLTVVREVLGDAQHALVTHAVDVEVTVGAHHRSATTDTTAATDRPEFED